MNKRIFILIVFFICVFLYYENNFITASNLNISSKKIPNEFNGYKIVHLSDLHGKSFGKNQKHLVEKIRKINPDIIFFTGDIIDRRRYNEEPSLTLIMEVTKIAPVYYVNGNHEIWSGKFEDLEGKLKDSGAVALKNQGTIIKNGVGEIALIGINDPALNKNKYNNSDENEVVKNNIKEALKEEYKNKYKILLSHRPEKLDAYSENNMDLVLCGHAHGGQIRLPFVGGIIAPNQGFFPKYTSGKHIKANCTMVVNRGLGNSLAPFRIFNRPEIIIITLTSI